MGQLNLIRTQFEPRVTVTTPANDDVQTVDFVGYFQIGDLVDVVEVDEHDNILNVISDNRTVQSIDPDTLELVLDQVVDTTGLTGTPQIRCQNIDDGQEAIDRLYRRKISGDIEFIRSEPILATELNAPVAGQTLFRVADIEHFRVGDTLDILADEGIISSNVTITSLTPQADDTNNYSYVAVNAVVDTSTYTNPYILAKDITIQDAIERLQEDIDQIDKPIENEYIGLGNGKYPAFYTDNLFVEGSTKLLIDGKRMLLGTAGTRATYSTATGDASELNFTSLILGLDGNKTKIAVASGAGLTVAVTGNFSSGYTITVNDNGGAATSQDIADAINADTEANKIVQAQYGGDGTGVVAAFAAQSLTGGLDDGTGDYAEIEQVYRNNISGTGFKIVSFHIRPNERNRMNDVPQDDEELVVDYRFALVNVDR